MSVSVTVGGVSKNIKRRSLYLSQQDNGRSTAAFTITSKDGTYTTPIDADVVISEDGTPIFGGRIDRPTIHGVPSGLTAAVESDVNAADYSVFADWRFVKTETDIPVGSLKTFLQYVVDNYLDDYGVTLDPAQVDGPTLPVLSANYTKLSDMLNQVMTLTGSAGQPFAWKISPSKVFGAYQPSLTAAPFNISDNTPDEVVGDIQVEYNRDNYANRVIITVPPKSEVGRVETFIGDGVTTTFQLQYTLTRSYGYVTSAGIFETLRIPTDPDAATWTYDPATNQITRTSAPANGSTTTISFDGTFTGIGIAEDAGEIASFGPREIVVQVDSVPTDTTAQALAEAYLAKSLPTAQTIRYRTLVHGVLPGMTQTVTLPFRGISGATAIISEVVIRDIGAEDVEQTLMREVTAVLDTAQTNLGRGWRDVYKIWAGDLTGASAQLTAGTVTANGGPANPNESVQFNNSGAFGGKDTFLFKKDNNSLVMGGGGSDITATDYESCAAIGYDCHVTD